MGHEEALRAYRQVDTLRALESASPHRLVLMLMDGAERAIACARGHLMRSEPGPKGVQIGRAITLIEGLRSGLDHAQGGEIAGNLDALYLYLQQRLLLANLDGRVDLLDEVTVLLRQIRSAWEAIDPQIQPGATATRAESAPAIP
jgi:flagellar protein FliS